MSKVITAYNLSKVYSLDLKNREDTLAGRLSNTFLTRKRSPKTEIVALRDVNLEVDEGDIVGIVGKNGAGKSTLLKVLSRITEPSTGTATINGRVSSLLEIGTGFHPDLTGRENVFMNGTLLGMKKQEIQTLFDEIVDFSAVENFIDVPVKKYSSGMKMRLAFAVAAFLNSEILFVDEVLAVGDVAFQQKCLGKMDEAAKSGKTVLFVSHNMGAIKNLCNRAIYLNEGRLEYDGTADEAVRRYLGNTGSDAVLSGRELDPFLIRETRHYPESVMAFTQLSVADSDFTPRKEYWSDEEINIGVLFETKKVIRDLRIIISLGDEVNNEILLTQASDSDEYLRNHIQIEPGRQSAVCFIPSNLLGEKEYFISVQLIIPNTEHLVLKNALSFNVKFKGYNNVQAGGFGKVFLRPKLNWKFVPANAPSLTYIKAG